MADPSGGDSEQRFGYKVRLKGAPMRSTMARLVADSARNVAQSVPTDRQFRVSLKSTTKTPAVRFGVVNGYQAPRTMQIQVKFLF